MAVLQHVSKLRIYCCSRLVFDQAQSNKLERPQRRVFFAVGLISLGNFPDIKQSHSTLYQMLENNRKDKEFILRFTLLAFSDQQRQLTNFH